MGSNTSLSKLLRSSFWLYILTIINNFFGYIYWFILSSIGGSSLLGLTSSVIGFASIINGFLSLGLPTSIKKFLGREYSSGSIVLARQYFWSTTLLSITLHSTVSLTLYILGTLGFSISVFTPEMLRASSIITVLGFTLLLRSYTASILKTELAFIATLIGNILKLLIGVTLVLYGYGWFGAVIGYVAVPLTVTTIIGCHAVRTLGFTIRIKWSLLREVLIAGFSSWIPAIAIVVGRWLGVLFVYGYSGASEAGHYYIALVIASLILMIGVSVINILLPVLAGMVDGRKRYSYIVLRTSLVISVPVSFYIIAYPQLFLRLLGSEYVAASNILVILLLSTIPAAVTYCLSSLLLVYGDYLEVFLIGLTQNIPRLIMYLVLTPILGGLGSGIAFTTGAYTGFIYSIIVSRRIGYRIDYRDLLLIASIPAVLLVTPSILNIPWFLGILLLPITYIVYIRARLLSRTELKEIMLAFLTQRQVETIYSKLKPFIDIVVPK